MLKADVIFLLDDQEMDRRRWSIIPRIGDEVMLKLLFGKLTYRVTRVVFGMETAEHDHLTQQCIHIHVELAE